MWFDPVMCGCHVMFKHNSHRLLTPVVPSDCAIIQDDFNTRMALDIERMYLRQKCSDGSVNKTILKPRLAAAGRQYVYVGFSRRKIPRYTISEKAIRFRHPDYNPDRVQKLISSSMSQHLSAHDISSKSMHAFLSNLANRQTDRHTYIQTNTGKNMYLLLCIGGN